MDGVKAEAPMDGGKAEVPAEALAEPPATTGSHEACGSAHPPVDLEIPASPMVSGPTPTSPAENEEAETTQPSSPNNDAKDDASTVSMNSDKAQKESKSTKKQKARGKAKRSGSTPSRKSGPGGTRRRMRRGGDHRPALLLPGTGQEGTEGGQAPQIDHPKSWPTR